ncbi:MAG: aminoacyl-tRNA hydrolase [Chloroflexi bacterium]|nr:aminoacyl-tRNA hydrolase [Chloroflexota bacterium]
MDAAEVTQHLLGRARWTASRSSGPGGQRRDKVETRAELTVDRACLDGLATDIAERLTEYWQLAVRPIRLTCQDERSLARNQSLLAERLEASVVEALAPPPDVRRPTRPSRAKRARRLDDKGRRGDVKRLRADVRGEPD